MKRFNSITKFIQKHSLGIYFFLTFAIAWLGVFIVVGPKFLKAEIFETLDVVLVFLTMLAGPIVSSILVALIANGKQDIKDLFSRMLVWRVGKWYLTLLIFHFLLCLPPYYCQL